MHFGQFNGLYDTVMKEKNSLVKAVGLDVDKSPIMEISGGRVLHNHAVMYILNGQGYFEDINTPRQKVVKGTVFYQYPNRWHRFDPDPGTVWTEYWILFDGTKSEQYFGELIPETKPIYNVGIEGSIIEAYEELYDLWLYPSRGYKEYSSLLLHKILAGFYVKINNIKVKRKDDIIHRAKVLMKHNLESGKVNFKQFADSENMSYENFRKRFKKETGFSPKQYFLMIKINRAKERLLRSNLSIKEICFELGFEDPYYFSRLFKKKEGLSPKQFKEENISFNL